jgi:hypothetical protein
MDTFEIAKQQLLKKQGRNRVRATHRAIWQQYQREFWYTRGYTQICPGHILTHYVMKPRHLTYSILRVKFKRDDTMT